MALTSTILNFELEVSDVDRGVYTSLKFKIAQHPSENAERVVCRVLAYALFYDEHLEFGRGLSHVDDPALFIAGDAGELALWVDVGVPSADRLHKAAKRCRVVVVSDSPRERLVQHWGNSAIHDDDKIDVHLAAPDFVREVADLIERRNSWVFLRHDGTVTLTAADKSASTDLAVCTVRELRD